MTVKAFCKKYGMSEAQFYGKEKIEGSLDLRSLTSIPEGFNPTVGGYLGLRSLTSIPKGFNPTVGGDLGLRSLASLPEGFSPTVGGDINLRSLTSIPKGFNPTVGGGIDLPYHLSAPKRTPPTVLAWQDGRYISVDGVFGEVISKHGDTYKCQWNNKEFFVIVVDGKASHGATIKEAKADLLYKIASRDMSKYEAFTLDTVVTFEEAIEMYRIITGACAFGTKYFVEHKLNENRKESYTVQEIITITKGEYGNEKLKEYFDEK